MIMEREFHELARCQCRDGCRCKSEPGPAAYLIEREGKQMMVCTRCKLSTDKKLSLLVDKTSPANVFLNYDALGFMCLTFELSDEMQEMS